MKEDIQYGIKALRVNDNGSGVVVRGKDGKEFSGDAVVVAVLLKLTHTIAFEPELFRPKRQAGRHREM